MFNGNFCIYFVHSSNCLCSASAFLISDTPGLFYFFGAVPQLHLEKLISSHVETRESSGRPFVGHKLDMHCGR